MAKRSGMYSSNKRKKELKRQKKQEDKILKRQKDANAPVEGADEAESIDTEAETTDSETESSEKTDTE